MKNYIILILIFVGLTAFYVGLDRVIHSVIIEDFESTERNALWTAKGSPNMVNVKIQSIPGGPEALRLYAPGETKNTCLGVKCAFTSIGYNFIELFPGKPIDIPGKSKSIDVWIAGLNFRYTAEIWVRDYLGFDHKLELGSIEHEGWRNLSVNVPDTIPQEEKHLPREHPLKLIKFVFRSAPDERADRFVVYIDHIKVITDIYLKKFDGDEMIRKGF